MTSSDHSHARLASRAGRDRGATAASEAVEDYAKAIYALERRGGSPVPTMALAARLGVAPPSVTAMLKRLDEMRLAHYEAYRGVTLTKAGERVALEVMRHHRLIEAFLADALDMPWDRVHEEAEVLEHYISEDLERRIAEKLGDPRFDPHGDPIPTAELSLGDDHTIPLSELSPGTNALFARVSDADPEMLRYLAGLGIRPGARLVVMGAEPFGGPLMVEADGRRHHLGGELARNMRVEVPAA